MTPVLYILMRTDLPSMNPGKAMAQASHASNAFVFDMSTRMDQDVCEEDLPEEISDLFNQWQFETPQGFGTVLVLGVTEAQMRTANMVAGQLGFIADIVTDPTYPAHLDTEAVKVINELTPQQALSQAMETADALLEDRPLSPWTAPCIPAGDKTVTFRSEDTCSYIFGDKEDPMLAAVVGNFKLHP